MAKLPDFAAFSCGTELDMSQRMLADIVGTNEQSIAKWEKARAKDVANKPAERLLRLAYINYLDGKPEFSAIIDRITQLDAEMAELELRMTKEENGAWLQVAA
jgi:putative transcriptional regulator